jgi:hypothetical protein
MGCSGSKVGEDGGSSSSPSDTRDGARGHHGRQFGQRGGAADVGRSGGLLPPGAKRAMAQTDGDAFNRQLGPDPYGKSLHNVMKDVEVSSSGVKGCACSRCQW